MGLTLLHESPLSPPANLGPYRRPDYEALPDEPRCELLYGRIYVTPSPLRLHQAVCAELWLHLDRIAAAAGGQAYFAPLDVVLAEHSVVQPDIIYLSRERRHLAQDRIAGAPDLLVEVLSPGTVRRDRGEKLRLYAECDVREYWIVDPDARQIEFLANRDGAMTVVLPVGGVYSSPALVELRLDVAAFWAAVERRFAG